ncbi:MAG: hypothetical protein EOO38_26900 [Cytophagaceae bacterium]|nr:MAG: hypothetical protein EOO38_26900 [Cytophagaceae bacterium]
MQNDPEGLGVLSRLLSRIGLTGPGELDRGPGDGLHSLAKFDHLHSLLFASWRHVCSQQVPQHVDCHMHLAASLAFVVAVAAARPALATRLQGTPVQDDCTGLALAAESKTDHRAQVHDHGLEIARGEPAAALLVDRLLDWELVGQQSSRRTRSHDPSRGIEDLPHAVLALPGVLAQQGNARSGRAPFFMADISWIRHSWHRSKIRTSLTRSKKL